MNKTIRHALLFATIFAAGAAIAQPVSTKKLDRTGLTKTFSDEFDAFSWYKVDAEGKHGGGTWATYFGYSWAKSDDIKNRVQLGNKEEGINVDPLFRGTGDKPLGLNPFSAKNGILNISATRAPDLPELSGYKYLTGMITTQYTFAQQYGVFEMRAKLPKGKGMWNAFWLLPDDKTWPPEIDIVEMIGHEPTKLYTTLHSKATGTHVKSEIPPHVGPDLSADFHTYAVDWGKSEVIFYLDDVEIARQPTSPDMHKPFFILVTLAIGGVWPGSPDATTQFPATIEIDWIRAWKRDGK